MSHGITYRCICCGKIWREDNEFDDEHHRWPTSQNGPDVDTNKVKACRDCHSLYTEICGQRLAMKVKARVANFCAWMKRFPPSGLLGQGLHPANMAPDFVLEEAGEFIFSGDLVDLSKGRLSTLGKIKQFKPKPPLRRSD